MYVFFFLYYDWRISVVQLVSAVGATVLRDYAHNTHILLPVTIGVVSLVSRLYERGAADC